MRLLALSDLHVRFPPNRALLERISPHPGDWLILAGDVGETLDDLRFALTTLAPKFSRLVWVPGNHELWTLPTKDTLRGEAKYDALVALCREFGALTPEDEYETFPPGAAEGRVVAPMFLLYDYTFRPDGVTDEGAIAWALEDGVLCTDEAVLHPDPHASRAAWCAARVSQTEARLSAIPRERRTILVNHFPLRQEHVTVPRVPRFSIWCGTKRSEDWHRRFRADHVVYGHLHVPATRERDGARFHEVSLGYPGQWPSDRDPDAMLRVIVAD